MRCKRHSNDIFDQPSLSSKGAWTWLGADSRYKGIREAVMKTGFNFLPFLRTSGGNILLEIQNLDEKQVIENFNEGGLACRSVFIIFLLKASLTLLLLKLKVI